MGPRGIVKGLVSCGVSVVIASMVAIVLMGYRVLDLEPSMVCLRLS